MNQSTQVMLLILRGIGFVTGVIMGILLFFSELPVKRERD